MRYLLTLVSLIASMSLLSAAVPRFHEDATLRAVQFIDDKEGWSVGDDGTIWHSMDGGETWEKQASGTRATLTGIHFLNPYFGWVIGRQEVAEARSVGVILLTTDGGLKWSQLAINSLPGLNTVKFFDQQNGIVSGDGSEGYPTGVFVTRDGGRSWKPVPGPRATRWQAADFIDADSGTLAGMNGTFSVMRKGSFTSAQVDSLNGKAVRAVKIQGNSAFAVGERGLLLRSTNSPGIRWGFAETKLPESLMGSIDFNAVAMKGNDVWVVGRPGSFVLHSADNGISWEMQATGQPLPLHAIHFVDANNGWAVGDMGTVVTTGDGGKTWKVVRQEGQRAAAMMVQSHADCPPLDAVAKLGIEEGYRLVSCRVTQEENGTKLPQGSLDTSRLNFAFRAAGGTSTDSITMFPVARFNSVNESQSLVKAWDASYGENRSRPALLQQFVLAIRTWRPEVVILDPAESRDSLAGFLREVWLEAFKVSADETVFPDQLSILQLEPWGVKKIYTHMSKADPSLIRVEVDTLSAPLENSPKDFVFESRRVLNLDKSFEGNPHFRLLGTRIAGAATHQSLIEGIELVEGATARRKLPPQTEIEKQRVKDLVNYSQTRTLLLKLGNPENTALAKPEAAMAMLEQNLQKMPLELGATTAFQLGSNFASSGRWYLARETFTRLVERYPGHPLSLEATRWLIRFNTSAEARRREELGNFVSGTTTSIRGVGSEKSSPRVRTSGGSEVQQSPDFLREIDLEEVRKRLDDTLKLESQLFAHGPLMGRDPQLQLCLQSAKRQLGKLDQVKKWSTAYIAETASLSAEATPAMGADPWRDCVLAESWLLNRTGTLNAPKPLVLCREATQRPHLDGKLDDACWKSARAMQLASTGTLAPEYRTLSEPSTNFITSQKKIEGKEQIEATTQAVMAYDSEYLYIGVQCFHPNGRSVPALEKRSRDMVVENHDRVEIMLDLDRDYQTYFRFQVDQRGAVAEDCWGDRSWNPRWFVAVHSEARGWSAEIAIPILELTGETLTSGKVWAGNVTRIIPGTGIQTWSGPADVLPRPEGMGLIQFAATPK